MDARLSFLARAAARWWLVENGEMEVDEAFDGLVNDICERRAIEKHFSVVWRRKREKELADWRATNGPNRMLRLRTPKGNQTDKEGNNISLQQLRREKSKAYP